MTSRSWLITIWNEQWQPLDTWTSGEHSIRYMCGQLEQSPTTMNLHYQIYMELKSPSRMSRVKDLLNEGTAHCEMRRGTRDEARAYCQKTDTYISNRFEYGRWETGGQGARSDIVRFKDSIMEGKDDLTIMGEHPIEYMKYFKVLDRVREKILEKESKRFRKLEVNVIVGKAGSGKTREVYDKYGYDDVYTLNEQGGSVLWFDGYVGQPILLIDEFYGGIKYSLLLRILDGHPVHLQIKGGWTWANWEVVYITSNEPPNAWYTKGLTDALKRRITSVKKIGDLDF